MNAYTKKMVEQGQSLYRGMITGKIPMYSIHKKLVKHSGYSYHGHVSN